MNTENIVEFYRPTNSKAPMLKRYSMGKIKDLETNRGIAWSGVIVKDGLAVATVSNDGVGGCNDYAWVNKAEESEFIMVARLAYAGKAQFEGEEEDILCAWLDIQANYASVAS